MRRLTYTQKMCLAALSKAPQRVDTGKPRGKGPRDRVMRCLCILGFAAPDFHGGYEITEAGQVRFRSLVTEADNNASRYLGNANEEREKGSLSTAQWHLDRAQKWLDELNDLQGQGSTDP